MRRITVIVSAVALLLALLPVGVGVAATPQDQGAGPRSYIVVLNAGDPGAVAAEHARRHNASVQHVYRHALRGYAAVMSDQAAARIGGDARVAHVEADQLAHAYAQDLPTGVRRIYADANRNVDIDDSDDYHVDVDVAIIDTGLDSDHLDLHIAGGTDCASGGWFKASCSDGTFEDGNGHGTHVGGTVGAIDNGIGVVGVAPGARLWGVRVLDDSGSGYLSWIIAGIDWVTGRAGDIEVANMSLGCECSSDAMDTAITNSVAAGVVYAVAAGNSDKDASTFSPANHPDVITVSALADFDGQPGGVGSATCRTDQDDTLADFSNFGDLVEIAAPGVCIASTWPGGGYRSISGTSMASPHVAGAAALLASTRSTAKKSDVDTIAGLLVGNGNSEWTDESGDRTKEPLLDVSNETVFAPRLTSTGSDGGGDTSNDAPTALFTYTCTDLSCSFTDASNDTDGTLSTWSWSFGDGETSTAQDPSHTYPAEGTYTVRLTVTDDGGASDTDEQLITVTAPADADGITLTAAGYKVKGVHHADLTWSGATSDNVDVYRDGSYIATTGNDGAYTDSIGNRGGGSYSYSVCEAGASTCSQAATVNL